MYWRHRQLHLWLPARVAGMAVSVHKGWLWNFCRTLRSYIASRKKWHSKHYFHVVIYKVVCILITLFCHALSSYGKLKLAGWGSGERIKQNGGHSVWGWYLFHGTRCQWKIPFPYTLDTGIFGSGALTDECFCADSSCWVMYSHQANIPTPCHLHSLNTLQVSVYHDYTSSLVDGTQQLSGEYWCHLPNYAASHPRLYEILKRVWHSGVSSLKHSCNYR